MTSPPSHAQVLIVDLTAGTGLHALRSLRPGLATNGPWRGLPLTGMPGDLQLDWHRPATAADLQLDGPPPLGVYVIVGPGVAPMLPAILAKLAHSGAAETGFLLSPNALMESIHLRGHLARVPPEDHCVLLQLPTSDAQALWMILLEQIDSLMRRTHTDFRRDQPNNTGEPMASNLKQSMEQAMAIEGAVAVALVDHRSGMCLAEAGGGMNMEVAAAGNSEVVRAKLRTIEMLGLRNSIEDILITLQHQYHLIRLIPLNSGLFLYLALDRQRGNLALARYKLTEIERNLQI